jgi:hypothetical protein
MCIELIMGDNNLNNTGYIYKMILKKKIKILQKLNICVC